MTDKAHPFEPTRTGGQGEVTRIASDRASGDAATHLVLPRPVATSAAGAKPAGAETPAAPAAASAAGPSLLQPGTVLNNTQRIEALVGRGGMGEVYRATNIHTGDQDAIKMVRPDLASDPQVRELFRREAAALRKVRHPSVVSYEGVFGDDSGRLFLVMEFVDGPSLASVIAAAPLPPADVRRVGVQIAEGLAAAHACGVVHRDLSPDNVVLRGGRLDNAVLIDFGVAKRLDATSTVVGSGFAGKLDYCSPEQCGLFDGVDHRTDIYSLGLVLAAAAVGHHLPMGSSLAHAVKARETQPDLSSVPEELRADLGRLIEPDPARRPQSMREVAALLAYDPAATPTAPARPASTARRTALLVGGIAAMVALFAGGVVLGPRLIAPSGTGVVATSDSVPGPTSPTAEQQRHAADAARQKADDDRRAADARRAAEEAQRQEAERAAAERRRQDDEAQRAAEDAARRAEAERREADQRAADQRAAEEARRRADEEAQRQAADRAAAERRRADEEAQRQAADRAAAERRRADEETQRRAEEARRQAEERRLAEEQRRAEEARRTAEQEPRPRDPANAPTPPARPQQAARTAPPPPVATSVDGAWRGQVCFRRLALTAGNETCGPVSFTVVAGGAASGSWVVNSVTYGVAGTLAAGGGQVTLEMPPTGRGSTLGGKFTLPVRLNSGALQGQGYTQNDVLVMFSANR